MSSEVREMHELERALRLGIAAELGAQPVLDRLDVVTGLGLDVLDVLGVAIGEVFYEILENLGNPRGKGLQIPNATIRGERL